MQNNEKFNFETGSNFVRKIQKLLYSHRMLDIITTVKKHYTRFFQQVIVFLIFSVQSKKNWNIALPLCNKYKIFF